MKKHYKCIKGASVRLNGYAPAKVLRVYMAPAPAPAPAECPKITLCVGAGSIASAISSCAGDGAGIGSERPLFRKSKSAQKFSASRYR